MGGEISKSLGSIQRTLVEPAIRSYYDWMGFKVKDHQVSQIMTYLKLTRMWDSVPDEVWLHDWQKLVKEIGKTVYHEGIKYTRINYRWTCHEEYWNKQFETYSSLHLETCCRYLTFYISTFSWQEAFQENFERKKAEEERKEQERWKKLSFSQKLKEKVLRRSYSSS